MMNTERLLLIPITIEHVTAICISRIALSQLIGCIVPESFPHFRNSFVQMLAHHEEYGSLPGTSWFLIDRAASQIIGLSGLSDIINGECELGYEVIPESRRQGFATEGCKAIVNWALTRDDVNQIIAHTLAVGHVESSGVLKKLKFVLAGDCKDPDTGDTVLKWILEP